MVAAAEKKRQKSQTKTGLGPEDEKRAKMESGGNDQRAGPGLLREGHRRKWRTEDEATFIQSIWIKITSVNR